MFGMDSLFARFGKIAVTFEPIVYDFECREPVLLLVALFLTVNAAEEEEDLPNY